MRKMKNKKPLPKKLGEEKFLKLNYANTFFMKSRDAFRTDYNPKKYFFTFKVVEGDDENFNGNKTKLVQIHLRTDAKDKLKNQEEVLDVDIYAFFDDFKKQIKEMIDEQ